MIAALIRKKFLYTFTRMNRESYQKILGQFKANPSLSAFDEFYVRENII